MKSLRCFKSLMLVAMSFLLAQGCGLHSPSSSEIKSQPCVVGDKDIEICWSNSEITLNVPGSEIQGQMSDALAGKEFEQSGSFQNGPISVSGKVRVKNIRATLETGQVRVDGDLDVHINKVGNFDASVILMFRVAVNDWTLSLVHSETHLNSGNSLVKLAINNLGPLIYPKISEAIEQEIKDFDGMNLKEMARNAHPVVANMIDQNPTLTGNADVNPSRLKISLKVPFAHGATLYHGGTLYVGDSMRSDDGRFLLVFQGDRNFVLYKDGVALWNAGTGGSDGSRIVMQGDGNLVMYNDGNAPVWYTNTFGSNVRLVVQSDGNVVLYSGNQALWYTGTSGH